MKPKTVLESIAELSPKVVEQELDSPPQASPKPRPASVQPFRPNQLFILVPEHSGFTGYPHWGLNE